MPLPCRSFGRNRTTFFTGLLFLKILYLRNLIFPQSFDLKIICLELASAMVIFGLLNLTKFQKSILFWAVNGFFSSLFLANAIYYSYFGQFINLEALRQIVMVKDLGPSIAELFSPAYLLFFLDFFLVYLRNFGRKFLSTHRHKNLFLNSRKFPFLLWALRLKKRTLIPRFIISFPARRPILKANLPTPFKRNLLMRNPSSQAPKNQPVALLIAFLFILVNILFYPEKENRMAMSREVGLLNAQGYALLAPFRKQSEDYTFLLESSLTQATINELKQLQPVPWPKYFAAAAGLNVILVQLESTESFLVDLKINGQEITPNLNKLIRESLYFPYFYSQIGQGNTSDAEFISNTSLYPRARGGVATDFIGIEYPSLPRLLKKESYISVTFHPNVITFWKRDNLYPCLGFDKYYDREFYQNEDLLGPWGSSDEVLFKKALPELLKFQKKGQKFYASLITLTNHHPFNLPVERRKIKLPDALEGTLLGNYLYSVNYQDYAFGLFLEDLKTSKLLDKSLLVVFGDHYGFTKGMDTRFQQDFSLFLGREHDVLDRLQVPFLIKVPGLKPQVIETVGGQVDILPTLANLLGISLDDQLVFGQDLLNYRQNLLGFRFYNPEGTLITGDTFYLPGSDTGINIKTREEVKDKEFLQQEEKRIKALLQLADSYMQYLDDNKKM